MIKFSVLIPLYNKEDDIIDTIHSVLNQSYSADEIIVVDDGSTDMSIDRIKSYFGDKITLISQKNSGETAARNRGLCAVKNEYVALIDADDLWEEDFLLEIKKLIVKYPSATFYSTASKSINENGVAIKNQIDLSEEFQGIIDDFSKVFARNYGLINSSSVCIRKSIFDQDIMFPAGEKRGGDLCYWLELSLLGTLAFSAKPLSIYRLDASNRSHMIHKEAIVPCPIKWFYQNHKRLKTHKYYTSIKKFIYSNLFITVYGGFGLSKNHRSIDAVIELMKQHNDRFYLLLYPAHWIPVWFLDLIKKLRRKMR
jgi:glycosyltransferase involved in cell wall biosynthesis